MFDIFVFQIVLIFIPGILWAVLDLVHGSGKKISFSFFVLHSFIFGFVVYLILGGIYLSVGEEFHIFNFANRAQSSFDNVWDEVLWSLLLAPFLSIAWLFVQTRNLAAKLLYACKITKRLDRNDVWTTMLNRGGYVYEFVRITDFEKNKIYEGFVDTYSENEEIREILLMNVKIFDFDGNLVQNAPNFHISHLNGNYWIEFPREQQNKKE